MVRKTLDKVTSDIASNQPSEKHFGSPIAAASLPTAVAAPLPPSSSTHNASLFVPARLDGLLAKDPTHPVKEDAITDDDDDTKPWVYFKKVRLGIQISISG